MVAHLVESGMAQLIVRSIDEDVKAQLKARAQAHGHSMEEEVRQILRAAMLGGAREELGLGTRIARRFRGIGLKRSELPEFPRQEPRIPKFE
jgi:plasmid stability protein